jgi:hypothetical protein
MTVTRQRLQQIAELAGEVEMQWARKPRTSSLAFWFRQVTQAVIALGEGQEQNEAEICALSDAVDDIDAHIDGIVGEVEDLELEPQDEVIVDLTTVPYEVDYNLEYNEARIIDDKLYVGSLFAGMLDAAKVASAIAEVSQAVEETAS